MNNHVEHKSQRLYSNLLSPISIFIVLLVITLASALPVYIVPTTPASGGHQESLVTIGLNMADAAKAGCTKECDYDCIPGPNGDCIAQKKFCWWECPPAPNPPTITSTLICSSWGSNNWCKGTLSIKLTATEPQNFNVLIDGDVNGTLFTCPAQAGTNTCTLPLSEGTGTITYSASSVSGQSADGSTDWQRDSAAPTLSGTLNGSPGQNGWFISNDFFLNMSAPDPLSGLASLTASVDGGSPITTNNTAIILADGSHTIVIVAADQAGNVAQSTQTVNVDTLTPVINQSLLGTMGNNSWYVTLLQVSANPSDATSHIALLEASVDGAAWSIVNGSLSLGDGHHAWQFRATDYAGNVNTTSQQEAYIDTTTPNISTSITGTTGNNGWYTTNVQISAIASDSGSGINSLEAATDGGAYRSYANPIIFSNGTHTYQFRATDSAGNVAVSPTGTMSPVGQVKVDNTSPSLSITINGTKGSHGWYISDTSIAVTTNDGMSGITTIQAKTDNSAWAAYTTPLQFSDGIHTYQFQVTDNAGNTTLSSVLTIKIDTIAPIVDIQDKWKVEDAVGYSAHDDGSGLYGARLVIEKSNSIKRTITDDDIQGVKFSNELTWDGWFNNGSKADAGDYPAEMKVVDVAGNEIIEPSTVTVDFSVLSLLPSIPFLGSDDPTPEPGTTADEQQYTFGNETSSDASNESSSSNYGGETNTNLDKLESVELQFGATKVEVGETSTFGFSNVTDFIFPPDFFNTENYPEGTTAGDTTSAILLSILAAAGLGAVTAETVSRSKSADSNVLWGDDAEDAKKGFGKDIAQYEWDHNKHPGNSGGGGAEENDGPKSYKQIAKEYAASRHENKNDSFDPETADMTEKEELATYKATDEYKERQKNLDEWHVEQERKQKLIAQNEDRAPLDMDKVNRLVQGLNSQNSQLSAPESSEQSNWLSSLWSIFTPDKTVGHPKMAITVLNQDRWKPSADTETSSWLDLLNPAWWFSDKPWPWKSQFSTLIPNVKPTATPSVNDLVNQAMATARGNITQTVIAQQTNSPMLTATPSPTPSPVITATPLLAQAMALEPLNLRTQPGLAGNILISIPSNGIIYIKPNSSPVNVDGFTWIQVNYTNPNINAGAIASSPNFSNPLTDFNIFYPFGDPIGYNNGMSGDWAGKHLGLDLVPANPTIEPNPPIFASTSGVVINSGTQKGYGNYLLVEYPRPSLPQTIQNIPQYVENDSLYVIYGHMMDDVSSALPTGAGIKPGMQIGTMGMSGNAGGMTHLHIEVRVGVPNDTSLNAAYGDWYDPNKLMPINPAMIFTANDTWQGWVVQSSTNGDQYIQSQP